ncbi:N-acetylglucosamine kinase [Radiobacillus sp. PE A8.2]|uniref:N-acetylglucosamine kinase n=1 Tax=Radiobacillus sp. PE A8.2 TaxID=3380349 RepID=UPI003890B071
MYVLAIDGGGTKTKGVIADCNGNVVASATVGASNPNSVSFSKINQELTLLIELLKQQSGDRFKRVIRLFAGMSGVEHPTNNKEMSRLLSSLVANDVKVSVDNDAITALYSGTFGRPGIVQIAGTGAIAYGLNERGERGRVGGWGYLFSDKGSGYQLGRDGLEAAFLAYDGAGNDTIIQQLLVDHFKVDDLSTVIRIIYQDNPRELIASLSRIVVQAADHGDIVAGKIIKKCGQDLGKSIASLATKLFSSKEKRKIPVVLTGGLFHRLDLFEGEVNLILEQYQMDTSLIIPQLDPVGGAVIAGWKQEQEWIDENTTQDFVTNFNRNEV